MFMLMLVLLLHKLKENELYNRFYCWLKYLIIYVNFMNDYTAPVIVNFSDGGTDWLTAWLSDWLTCWLTGWLTDWLFHLSGSTPSWLICHYLQGYFRDCYFDKRLKSVVFIWISGCWFHFIILLLGRDLHSVTLIIYPAMFSNGCYFMLTSPIIQVIDDEEFIHSDCPKINIIIASDYRVSISTSYS